MPAATFNMGILANTGSISFSTKFLPFISLPSRSVELNRIFIFAFGKKDVNPVKKRTCFLGILTRNGYFIICFSTYSFDSSIS